MILLEYQNIKTFTVEKVIKRKGDKLYVKQKGYDKYDMSLIVGLIKMDIDNII